MNKERRKLLEKLIDKLGEIEVELNELIDQEQEYYDNMPEGIQAGAKGDEAENAISNMEAARDGLEEIKDYINFAINGDA